MVQYDLNKVYLGKTKQDDNTSNMANSKMAKITRRNTCILIPVKRNDHLHCGNYNIHFL